MEHKLPPLPYAMDALSPTRLEGDARVPLRQAPPDVRHEPQQPRSRAPSSRTLSLEEIVKRSSGGIFNNAAQVWNHTFYWNSLAPRAAASRPARSATRSRRSGATSARSRKRSRRRPSASSARAGPGSSRRATASTSSTTGNADTPLRGRHSRSSRSTSGSTPTTSTTATRVRSTSKAFWNIVNWDFANKNLG